MSDGKKSWGIANNLMTVIALLATVFSCVLALLALTSPQKVASVIFQISGTTPEPEIIVITAEPQLLNPQTIPSNSRKSLRFLLQELNHYLQKIPSGILTFD